MSVRCLRNKIRAYDRRGENVPAPQLPSATEREASKLNTSEHSGGEFLIVAQMRLLRSADTLSEHVRVLGALDGITGRPSVRTFGVLWPR
jgi:hypothetical protein